jgi:hypothetical protein
MSDLTADTDAARLAWGGSPVKAEAPKLDEEDQKSSPEPTPVTVEPPPAASPPPAETPSQKPEAPLASPAEVPATPAPATQLPTPSEAGFIPLVSVVDFHHARGPEVEKWFGPSEGTDPAVDYDWGLLPFMALSDGAHA